MAKQTIPTKNYVILIGIILLVITACFATYNLYNIYQEQKIKTSPLATKEILYEDLKNATKEIDADTFLVISYTENEVVNEHERQIHKMLKKKDLLDNVMYLNVVDYMNNEGFIEELNGVIKLKDKMKIKELPAIVYYKDGQAVKTIDSKEQIINVADFEQLIDMYELAS